MKNFKFVFFVVLLLVLPSCHAVISVNALSVKIKDKTVKTGEKLKVKVKARDSDGIESIVIKIPILDTEQVIDNGPDNNKWEVNRDFLITDDVDRGSFLVEVTLTDKDGNEETDVEDFTIK